MNLTIFLLLSIFSCVSGAKKKERRVGLFREQHCHFFLQNLKFEIINIIYLESKIAIPIHHAQALEYAKEAKDKSGKKDKEAKKAQKLYRKCMKNQMKKRPLPAKCKKAGFDV